MVGARSPAWFEVGHAARRILGKLHDVDVVIAAKDGLSRLADNDYDLILCDLMMPELTGMDLHRELETKHPELATRVVFMTGGVFSPDAESFVRDPRHRVIHKPLDGDSLRRIVANVGGI